MATYVTECSNVDSKCAGYDSNVNKDPSTAYKCSNHRYIDVSRKHFTFVSTPSDYPKYDVGTLIEAIDIESIYQTLSLEISARQQHILYNGATSVTGEVKVGDVIDDVQQTSLKTMIENIGKIVNSNKLFGDTSLGTKLTSLNSVSEGDEVKTTDIRPLSKAISRVVDAANALVQDCICYSDCTNYYTFQRQVGGCGCVSNYGCCYG